jgi:hypothetical protein
MTTATAVMATATTVATHTTPTHARSVTMHRLLVVRLRTNDCGGCDGHYAVTHAPHTHARARARVRAHTQTHTHTHRFPYHDGGHRQSHRHQVHWGRNLGLIVVAVVGIVVLIAFVAAKRPPPTPDDPSLEEIETIAAIMVEMADVIASVEATVADYWDTKMAVSHSSRAVMTNLLKAKRDHAGIARWWAEGRFLGLTVDQIAVKNGA